MLSFIWDSNLGLILILAWMFNTSELDELFWILNSIKGFKLRQPQWSNTTQVLTRSMAKTVKADVPAMYPLKGDHKKPEKSQIGIIEVKDTEEVGQGEVQIVPNQQPDIEDNIMAEIDNVNIPDIV